MFHVKHISLNFWLFIHKIVDNFVELLINLFKIINSQARTIAPVKLCADCIFLRPVFFLCTAFSVSQI